MVIPWWWWRVLQLAQASARRKDGPAIGAIWRGRAIAPSEELGVTAQPKPCTLLAVIGITMDQKKVLMDRECAACR